MCPLFLLVPVKEEWPLCKGVAHVLVHPTWDMISEWKWFDPWSCWSQWGRCGFSACQSQWWRHFLSAPVMQGLVLVSPSEEAEGSVLVSPYEGYASPLVSSCEGGMAFLSTLLEVLVRCGHCSCRSRWRSHVFRVCQFQWRRHGLLTCSSQIARHDISACLSQWGSCVLCTCQL